MTSGPCSKVYQKLFLQCTGVPNWNLDGLHSLLEQAAAYQLKRRRLIFSATHRHLRQQHVLSLHHFLQYLAMVCVDTYSPRCMQTTSSLSSSSLFLLPPTTHDLPCSSTPSLNSRRYIRGLAAPGTTGSGVITGNVLSIGSQWQAAPNEVEVSLGTVTTASERKASETKAPATC
jgi:hypothetical protein